jgi:hypothetical protein
VPARRGYRPRAKGTAPPAEGTAPRAEETAPRAEETAPRARFRCKVAAEGAHPGRTRPSSTHPATSYTLPEPRSLASGRAAEATKAAAPTKEPAITTKAARKPNASITQPSRASHRAPTP